MNPQLKAKLYPFRMIIPFLALVTVILVVVMYAERVVMEETLVEKSMVEPLEWLYVQKNNVLVWPVVNGACRRKGAVAQYHQGEMVLVVARVGLWVEVESENQLRLHTHGCISETMLGPENPNGLPREAS
jgi:hypothetical protein